MTIIHIMRNANKHSHDRMLSIVTCSAKTQKLRHKSFKTILMQNPLIAVCKEAPKPLMDVPPWNVGTKSLFPKLPHD